MLKDIKEMKWKCHQCFNTKQLLKLLYSRVIHFLHHFQFELNTQLCSPENEYPISLYSHH